MINDIYILGGHVQALGIARQARAKGIQVHVIINDGFSIARFSNAVSETLLYENLDQLLKYLMSVESTQDKLLFPTDDEMILFMVDNREVLSQKFLLGIPDDKTVDLFNDKRETYRFAEKNCIPHPKSWYPDSIEDVVSLSKQLAFPVVVKPSVMFSFHKAFGKKAYRCNNADELVSICKLIEVHNYPLSGILIQEFLTGGPQYLYSYGTFAVEGEPKAYLMANRIRQNPMDFGNSTTFAVTCNIPRIRELAERILNVTRYSGLAEVEFMYDPVLKDYKFLEVNTRAWKWHSISNQLGYSFVGKMIDYFNGDTEPQSYVNARCGWVDRLTDFAVITKSLSKKIITLKSVKDSYSIRKEHAVWNWHDMVPGIMYVVLSPILYFKRH